MSDFEYEPYFVPEIAGDEEIMALDGSFYYLSPENTQINIFESGSGKFDHLLHIYDREETTIYGVLMFFDQFEDVDPELVDRLLDKDFPLIEAERPDKVTLDYYVDREISRMQSTQPEDLK
jgi:hypothetical protein